MADDLFEERTVWQSTPLRLQIEANRRCQIRCVHCDIQHVPDSVMDFGIIERLFEEAGDGAIEIMPYTGGEPALAPLEDIANLCRRKNAYLTFTTNGMLLHGARYERIADVMGRLCFSFHSHLPEVFERIERGARYETVLENFRACIRIAERYGTQVLAGSCLMNDNIEQLGDWFQFVADLGVRQVGLTNLHPNTPDRDRLDVRGNRSATEIEDLVGRAMEVAIRNGVFVETNVPEAYYTRFPANVPSRRTPFDILQDMNGICAFFRPGFCTLAAIMLVVEYDGTVLPCCRGHLPIGNLHRESFQDIWNGERMQRLRQSFLQRTLYRECFGCMNFYSDTLHPSVPPIADLGVSFHEAFASREAPAGEIHGTDHRSEDSR
ncbi:MAG: SPASM domain-containing protein [Planctomycetes bacterium]|nr:SPASM domain-containing protein [Planctomycetota bacterium]